MRTTQDAQQGPQLWELMRAEDPRQSLLGPEKIQNWDSKTKAFLGPPSRRGLRTGVPFSSLFSGHSGVRAQG